MPTPQTQFAGGAQPRTKRVYYTGTDQLLVGYNLNYDVAATVNTAGAVQLPTQRGNAVVKPATANLMFYAGAVAVAPPGIGPCYVDIWEPTNGAVLNVFCHVNATAGTTALATANNDYGLVSFADSTLNLPLKAVAMETADTSSTAANKLVYFK